jgi:hypothetical protein
MCHTLPSCVKSAAHAAIACATDVAAQEVAGTSLHVGLAHMTYGDVGVSVSGDGRRWGRVWHLHVAAASEQRTKQQSVT